LDKIDNIYDKIQELLGEISGNVTILEDQIDAETQVEYFNYASNLHGKLDPEEVLKNKDNIFSKDTELEQIKRMLVQLANIESIEAYRTLEKYHRGSPAELKDWARLALHESRLLLESKLLDENHVLISTGLGGKGLKLRYFTVIVAKSSSGYSSFQQKLLGSEIEFAVNSAGGDIEWIIFDRELCTAMAIIPLQTPVQKLFDQVITECNQFGNFINDDYIITNVRQLKNHEIRKILKQSRPHRKNPARQQE
jgi:hypothetical protein